MSVKEIKKQLFSPVKIVKGERTYTFFDDYFQPFGSRFGFNKISLTFELPEMSNEYFKEKVLRDLFYSEITFNVPMLIPLFHCASCELFERVETYSTRYMDLLRKTVIPAGTTFNFKLDFRRIPEAFNYTIQLNIFGINEVVE